MRALLAGLGALEAFGRGGEGRVVASFRRACYVAMPGGAFVLVDPDVPPGPVHVVLVGEPPRLEPGRPVRIAEAHLIVGDVQIALDRAAPWRGELPDPAAVGPVREQLATEVSRWAAGSPLSAAPFEGRARVARGLLGRGRLLDAATALAGLGPGLTPSGDDALAGVAFALRATIGPGVERLTAPAAAVVSEGSLGRGFVAWAARGQALAPVHDLFLAAVRGDRDGTARAGRRIAGIGETSGRDLLLGLAWGLAASAAYEAAASDVPSAARGELAVPRAIAR